MSFVLPRIYPITDTRISGLSHAEQVERLAAGGATLIQLRDKTASPREFHDAATEALQVARRLGVRIIINDRVDVAAAIRADGVHLGQDDIPPKYAHNLLGENCLVGVSSHTLKQALEADIEPVDYIAVGPVFETGTKADAEAIVGLEGLSEIVHSVSKPIVAIGGITLERVHSVIAAGAHCAAIISDILSAEDIAERTRGFLNRVQPNG